MLFGEVTERLLEHMRIIDRSQKTIDLYSRDLGIIRRYLESRHNGPVYLEDVTVEDLESFMCLLKDVKKYSPSSRSRFFYTIRSLYNYASKKGLVEGNLAQSMDCVKLPKREREYVEEEDILKVVGLIRVPVVRLVAFFLFNTGLRISECLNLTIRDVDLDKKTVFVREGKGNKDRIVPINGELYKALLDYRENWRDAPGSDFFFATRKTGSLSYPYVSNLVRQAGKEAGIGKPISPHVFRHDFASTLVKKNVGIVQISKLLGHSSLAVTSVYTHADMRQLSDAVNALDCGF